MVSLRDATVSMIVIIVIVSNITAKKGRKDSIYPAFEKNGSDFLFQPEDMSNCPAGLARIAPKVCKGKVQRERVNCRPSRCKTDLQSDDTEPIVGLMKNRRRYFKHTCDFCAETCAELKKSRNCKNGNLWKTYKKMHQSPRDGILRQPSTVYCISRHNRTVPKYCSSIQIHYLPELPSWEE